MLRWRCTSEENGVGSEYRAKHWKNGKGMMGKKILITGGSIAGYSAAWWLARYGFDVSVLEKSENFRDGGQNIDVRGVGRDVLKLMRLEKRAFELCTGEEGTVWIDEDGKEVAKIITAALGSDGPTAELEILRGDLSKIIYKSIRPNVNFRFGDEIRNIQERNSQVHICFEKGHAEAFDVLIIAEGAGSRSREMVFPGENSPRSMDLTMAFFTIPRIESDNKLWNWFHTTQGRSISLRPDCHGTTRALLSIQKPPSGEDLWDQDKQKSWLRENFKDAGWEATRVLRGMEAADDFYFDCLRQVQLKTWFKGRVVLLGDAAWCVTPIGGIGATLALTGARILAGELAQSTLIEDAFTNYERTMRPMVNEGQKIPKIAPRLMNPKTVLGLRALHLFLKFATKPPVLSLASKIFQKKKSEPDVYCYPE